MTNKIADPLLTAAKFEVERAHSSLVFIQTQPDISRELYLQRKQQISPHTTLPHKLHCYPSFRPHFADHSGFWLLTSCWWRESDPGLTAGSSGHWAEADDSHLFLSLPEAVQYLYFLNSSGLKSTPCGPVWQCRGEGLYDVWYGCKWWWQIDVMLRSLTARGLWEGRKFQRKTARYPAKLSSLQFLKAIFSILCADCDWAH